MRKISLIMMCLFTVIGWSQNNSQKKDTVKTEVVEIETKYNPKIADAKKIKQQPKISILKESGRQKLSYNIFSVPVASTFTPKTGVVKGIDVGVKERIYNNYVALGYGNYNSPYAEFYMHHNTRFSNAFGLHLRYNASLDNIGGTQLNSGFSDAYSKIFYSQEERFFDWKVSLSAKRSEFNWYGLPAINFSQFVIDRIEEQQQYNQFNLQGEVNFQDSKLDYVHADIQYFNDQFGSSELLGKGVANFKFPADFLVRNYDEIEILTGLDYLIGGFDQSYSSTNAQKYQFLNLHANPTYKFMLGNLSLKLGTKIFLALDVENDLQHFLVYPDVQFQFPLVKDALSVYGGATGDLHTNTYQNFTNDNPFVSPTLFMTQTNEQLNLFGGISALVTNRISFHLKASRKTEEDKALFVRNNSKSDGLTIIQNNATLQGYEFGNSFGVTYDDVTTTSFLAELEFEASKKLAINGNIRYSIFETTNAAEAWNLSPFEASIFAKYKNNQWYASASMNFIGARKDALYSSTYPSSIVDSQTINGFLDANLNGGYHFNDKFTVFLKINNFINGSFQQFTNFNVQGFQATAGLSYKFDF